MKRPPGEMTIMKHAHTNELYIYWNRIRGRNNAPERAAIEPADIRQLLKDTFILKVDDVDTYPFRLAGTRTCALFGREMKGRNFLDVLNGESADAVKTLLHSTGEDATVCVVGFVGKNATGHSIPLEMLLLPLRLNGKTDQRILGSLSPLKMPYWAGMQPITELHLASLRMIMPHQHKNEIGRLLEVVRDSEPNISPISGARKIGHLQVVDGGLQRQ